MKASTTPPVQRMRARGERGPDGVVEVVFFRPGLVVLERELDGDPDVEDHAGQQTQPHRPQRRPQALQKVGIAVDLVGRGEDLEVADEVAGDETRSAPPR